MPTRVNVPATRGRGKPQVSRPSPPETGDIALLLAIGRHGIGLELARPARLGCVRVTDLAATLPGVRFPVDVSGGVARFRHQRGQLERLELEIAPRVVERWAAPKLTGVVGTRRPEVWIAAERAKATVCVTARADAGDESDRDLPIVAFDVHALAEGSDIVLVVSNARGSALPAPATVIAIACVEAVLGQSAERAGAMFLLGQVPTTVARALLPEVGARIPSADQVSWCALATQGSAWVLSAARGSLPAAPSADALRAREIAVLLREADETAVAADLPSARTAYLEAQDRAPRHDELIRRIVEIDARVEGRAEAALASLADARRHGEGPGLGILGGVLHAEVGDVDAAVASFDRAAEAEPAPALAARAYELAARTVRDPEEAVRRLDRALARAPRAVTARWARVGARLTLGRLEDALADVQHLEALAPGAHAKHTVWMRAGRAWQAAGLGSRTGTIFENALRFAPDAPEALAGLGTAMVAEGREDRGVSVLARALDVAQASGKPSSFVALQLARALAEKLDDLPTAVARTSSIPSDAPEALLARGFEGRWRAQLGDLVGAGLAFARLRDLAAALPPATRDPLKVWPEMPARPFTTQGLGGDPLPPNPPTSISGNPLTAQVVDFLLEAAVVEETQRRDPLAAQRYLGVALRLSPHHPDARRAYRRVGALLSGRPSLTDDGPPAPDSPDATPGLPDVDFAGEVPHLTDDDAERHARVDGLTRRLQADPKDDAVADELASLLEILGRGHELLALLSARLEEATPERRAALLPRARSAFERLAEQARADGRDTEAALYADALAALSVREPRT